MIRIGAQRGWFWLLCPALLLGSWMMARGQSTSGMNDGMSPEMSVMTPERESAALLFAQRNHPELRDLLDHLRTSDPEQYKAALVDLFRTSERLAGMQARMPERHGLELEKWKLDSRIRLLTARFVMTSAEDLQEDLRELLAARVRNRVLLLQEERSRIETRLQRINQQIDELSTSGEATVERELTNLLRTNRNRRGPAPDPGNN